MSGAVVGHDLLHVVVKGLPVFLHGHVYEVDHDDAAHIAQTQLTRYLVGGGKIYVKGIRFLVGTRLAAVARVDVDHMQRLGALDDDVRTAAERHRLAKTALDLPRDGIMVKDGNIFVVELYDIPLFGRYQRDIFPDLFERLLVVDEDVLKIRREQVANHAENTGILLVNESRSLGALHFEQSVLPAF